MVTSVPVAWGVAAKVGCSTYWTPPGVV